MKPATLLAIALVAAGVFWPQLKTKLPDFVPGIIQPDTPATPTPDGAAQAAVQPVKAALAGKPERAKFRNYFATLAKAIELQPEAFRTVGAIEEHQRLAAKLFIQQAPGGVDGLSPAIAQALTALLGVDDKAIEPAAAIRAVRALEWACQ